MQRVIHRGGAGARPPAREQRGESLRILPAAFEARPVTGGERRHFVEEEQFTVTVAPHRAVAIVELKPAADPLLRCPAPRAKLALRIVQSTAAISHEQSARRSGEQIAKRIDAVLQGHRRGSKTKVAGTRTTRPPYPFREDPVTRTNNDFIKPKADAGALIKINNKRPVNKPLTSLMKTPA
ncbi:MAG TPA: hypothetical protein VGF53_13380 [Pseudolabrys sp.]